LDIECGKPSYSYNCRAGCAQGGCRGNPLILSTKKPIAIGFLTLTREPEEKPLPCSAQGVAHFNKELHRVTLAQAIDFITVFLKLGNFSQMWGAQRARRSSLSYLIINL
tara:strand:- start:1381 stop:1707 length:327 start_codon:yes stop_codon:yes gene_type:complete